MEWRWINPAVLLAIHDAQLSEHGGRSGIRDQNLLESALHRPKHKLDYGTDADAASLAAAYAYGIARNHPFFDGNKRSALVAAELFLELNNYELIAEDAAVLMTFTALAAGDIDEDSLAAWFRQHLQTLTA